MASPFADAPVAPPADSILPEDIDQNDPFLSASTSSNHHRFSHFDSQLFALGPTTSPEQAKRALEAHLAETERRIQEASKLGTDLVQQRKDLADRLKDVEKQQTEGDISPELRQKLVEIEKEFNEVGRESARAFLPKSRVSSAEMAAGSPFAGEGRRSISPSKFESQATNSPSKLTVPTRKQRNQASNRVHDIEFATEISTSLLSQVRHLQALLAEKDEALKTVTYEKSRLEIEAEGFNQRLRALDESEHRYKDENWNLETQIHEFLAAAKEAADREKKLTQSLNIAQAEKGSVQKELDEIKLNHAKLVEDHAAALKHHDVEFGNVKRNMTVAETERNSLQRKVEDLTGQNQELAKAIASHRGRQEERDEAKGLSDEDFETANDNVTPEHSPPPSPIKGTPRHSMLESETLKSSLHHAHRMIQSLKGNIHREKTEKLELKRMLQDARDELEARRNDGGLLPGSGKKNRKVESKEFKKPLKPGQLGGPRSSRSEIMLDDTNWEEDDGQRSPTELAARAPSAASGNDATDDFETANERATETEDFQTGQEDLSSGDELTETEAGPSGTLRKKSPPLALTKVGNRESFQSTASTSGDEFNYDDIKTPTTQPQRLRLKLNRGGSRRAREVSEEPQFQSSPPSFASSSNNGTPQAGKSLFAELGDMGGSDDESIEGTPSRSIYGSQTATPASRPSTAKGTPAAVVASPPLPRLPMIDSGMMTEPWEPAPATPVTPVSAVTAVGAGLAGASVAEGAHLLSDKHASVGSQTAVTTTDSASQHDPRLSNISQTGTQADLRPLSTAAYSDRSSQYEPAVLDEKLADFPAPPVSEEVAPPPLSMSTIVSEHVEPIEPQPESLPDQPKEVSPPAPLLAPLALSTIRSVHTEPISPKTPTREAAVIAGDGPETPKPTIIGSVSDWIKGKSAAAPIIAEDETRQSPSDSPAAPIPASRLPFKELSGNASERAGKSPLETNDESAQTTLTSDEIDELYKSKKQSTILAEDSHKSSIRSPVLAPASPRRRRSQESINSVNRSKAKAVDSEPFETTSHRRQSSKTGSISSVHPPLPTDHKQVIAAAAQRTGSSSGGAGSMGPPAFPASAYRTSSTFRPKTPTTQTPISPLQGGTTPRAVQSGRSEVHSATGTGISRRSSVSSFASEMDARFNMQPGLLPHGLDPRTDPRMINAITQTMIGEYLWKYTRKAGRGAMSENRHRRYFWVHPYTRTLYWSDHDPSQAGRGELKAKSVPIEAVRVVTDDNPMPPGLHRKSLVIMTPGRDVKFTASTGQRHETWFNALSYLLLRTGEETAGDTAEVANGLTREDVDEFNPGFRSSSRRGPTSLYSYNSRTTRNESPNRKSVRASVQPQTVHNSTSSRQSMGTLSRLSTYLRNSSAQTATQSSRRSRQSIGRSGSIYEASEVHDSAEDLREMIEKQDRESDKLEDVRACCDGKHHVGHLHSHSTKGRHSHNFNAGTTSSSRRQSQPRQPSRNSITRRTE